MPKQEFVKPERIILRNHPELSEKWVQERIATDPEILGLGSLIVKDKERTQPRAGRLDLLLQDSESDRRYEVEIQLGRTDESHIIRTIEYWDIERRRYPQYDHCAVIVAEEINARFLNVIGLFNGHIPLIAIQMSAYRIEGKLALIFTRVLDELPLGLDDDDDIAEVTDRAYWEQQGTKQTVALADEVLKLVQEIDPAYGLKYNKFYIGLAKNGQPDNFITMKAKKQNLRIEPRMEQSDTLRDEMEDAGLDLMEYEKRAGRYRIRLTEKDLTERRELIGNIIRQAYEATKGEARAPA